MTPKRAVRLAALALIACLIAGAVSLGVVGSQRRTTFDAQAASLQRTWAHDLAVGVPATSIAPLRSRLRRQRPVDEWWSPAWWTTTGQSLLTTLTDATNAAYAAAMAVQRDQAQLVLTDWQTELAQDRGSMTASEISAGQSWPAQLRGATTPDQLVHLAAAWQQQLDATRTAVVAVQQQAAIQADVATAGGPAALISEAGTALTTAGNDDLDPGDIATLAGQLQGEVASGADTTQTAGQLYTALQQFDQLVALNNQLNGEMRPLMLLADQASAEDTPNSTSLQAQYQAADQGFLADTTYDQMSALQAQVTVLQSSLTAELAANQCGYATGPGKAITISLSLQQAVFYDNGCVVSASPVTTGRPGLRTPTGDFSVFYKTSPFTMVSPWPPGSPDWYPTTVVQWVLEFADGYFLHDAYWENQNAFGPGSENEVAQDYASHGCIHFPTVVMQWLYTWTPLGTPVTVTN
ncbi:MAG: L,D-transpeptidase [Candidatus Dormibacteria bacterium]|jgi:lipoprotein-anchoring transpeptidase ErfK/SrfK